MGANKRITEHPNYENVEAFTLKGAEEFCWLSQTVSVFRWIKLVHRLRDERDAARERVRQLEGPGQTADVRRD